MVWTPLHTAARDGDLPRLRRCLDGIKWREPIDINAASTAFAIPRMAFWRDPPELLCTLKPVCHGGA
jgi:hypothetical protein